MKPANRYDFKMTSSTTHPFPGGNVYMQGQHPGRGGLRPTAGEQRHPLAPAPYTPCAHRARCPERMEGPPERPRPTPNAAQTDHSSPGQLLPALADSARSTGHAEAGPEHLGSPHANPICAHTEAAWHRLYAGRTRSQGGRIFLFLFLKIKLLIVSEVQTGQL